MKKIYISPTMKAITLQTTHKICIASLASNQNLKYGGETDDIENFTSDNVR